MSLVLIDTSVWVDVLRDASNPAMGRMQNLINDGTAAWCEMVRLELAAGTRDAKQRKQLSALDEVVAMLSITDKVWKDAWSRAGVARSKGITAPSSDHLIYSCALHYNAELWHNDRHFELLERL